ncbi:MAG: gamma-glutamyltransferase [Acidobacteria bacterium]|nr:MAG: gamma-glutamyltransferase [Acidobacteriota bacterium]
MWTGNSQGQDRGQARSMVISRNGIVAAESPLAAQAGVRILEQGGNAVDAAIATNAMMGVVEPMMNGIGGDLFALVYDAKANKLYGLNASGWAPKGLTIEYLAGQGIRSMPQQGVNSITVPGAVDGWQKLADKFGRKKLAENLAAAIRTAQEGFPVPEWDAAYWAGSVNYLRTDEAAAKTYLPEDRAPRVGEVFRNPDLAWSLEQIARHGRDAFYKGEIATKILESMKRHGGPMAGDDLAEFSSEFVEPISTTYRDWTVYELPPNVQGLAALEMLNIMETFPLGQKDWGFASTNALHTMIEAKKLAYADLLKYIGDSRKQKLPVATLLSKEWAGQRAKQIDVDHAKCDATAGEIAAGNDTTYLSVVDREGNMVSLIQSNYELFGSGIVAPGTGFALHDRGGLFSLDPASPNALAGRKRPLHTIIPAFAQKGDSRVAFGIMGGWNQSQAHAQFIADLADFKMNIQAALEAPRFSKHSFGGCDVMMENRIPQKVRDELAAKGHQIALKGTFSSVVGGGQAVMRDFSTGVNYRLSGENRYPQGRSSRHTGLYKSLQLKDLTSSHLANELHLSFRPGCAGRSQATWTWRCPWAFGSLKAYGGSGRLRFFCSRSLPHVPLKPPTSPAATSARKPRCKAK